jgi:hypothetical protein
MKSSCSRQGFKAPVGLVAGATGAKDHEGWTPVKKKACEIKNLDYF